MLYLKDKVFLSRISRDVEKRCSPGCSAVQIMKTPVSHNEKVLLTDHHSVDRISGLFQVANRHSGNAGLI